MIVNRHLMRAVLDEMPADACKRSAYGNLADCAGVRHADVKIRRLTEVPPDGAWFTSTGDAAWNRGAVGPWLRNRFPLPCPWEVVA